MNCPVCRKPMVALELQQIEIDHCPYCGGIWLDKGELELLLSDMSKEDLLLSSIKVNDIGKEKVRKCPICSKKMLKVWVGLNKRFLIDKCKKSDGLWFDRGELESVIADIDLQSESKILTLLKDIFKHNSN